MKYSFVLRHEATKEFADAYVWYEEQQEGLGDLFEIRFQNKLNRICNYPFQYKASHKQFHEAFVDVFPFLIIYTIKENAQQIIVFAIFHTSRNPKNKFRK